MIIYSTIMCFIHKDKDFLYNYYSTDRQAVFNAKLKYYLHNFITSLFVLYAFSHETMDPPITERYPGVDVESMQKKEKYH